MSHSLLQIASTTTTNNNVVSAEVSITVDDNDNGVEYRCEASNSASIVPMVATTRLTVYCKLILFLFRIFYIF